MNKNFFKISIIAGVFATGLASCNKDLNQFPANDVTADVVYATPASIKQAFAKVYGSYATTGNIGAIGSGDVQGLNEGQNADFLRTWWNAQELTTDEAVVAWSDPGLPDFHNLNWSALNDFLTGLYYRSIYQITLCNEFLRQTTEDKIAGRGITGADADAIKQYRNEARFLRAFQYWILLDEYGNPPFITENNQVGDAAPQQISRTDLFKYIETELLAIEPDITAARANEYGRADRGAVWALLARLYLNAEVYTGTKKFTEAINYSKKVIDAGYKLIPQYRNLMTADNNLNTDEFILTINMDGERTRSDGGTNFIVKAATGGSVSSTEVGLSGQAWAGIRVTEAIPMKFPNNDSSVDKRGIFHTGGQTLQVNNVSEFTQGYAVTKFRNVTRNGLPGKNASYVDIDFPLFRLAEMYLIYAEAVLRGGTGGDNATALNYVNLLRQRAYQGHAGDISSTDLTLDFLLDERARELYWECFRRTDLIRYNRFVEGTYLWPWKGGIRNGRGVESFRKLFPLPVKDVIANPNLKQNSGY